MLKNKQLNLNIVIRVLNKNKSIKNFSRTIKIFFTNKIKQVKSNTYVIPSNSIFIHYLLNADKKTIYNLLRKIKETADKKGYILTFLKIFTVLLLDLIYFVFQLLIV